MAGHLRPRVMLPRSVSSSPARSARFAGEVLLHENRPAEPEAFLAAVAPYRDGLVVAAECIFTWYCLADPCAREKLVGPACLRA
jgi:hypothetical protein